MRSSFGSRIPAAAPLAAAVAALGVGSTHAQTTERVSLDSNGFQGNVNSQFPSIAGYGRYVAFHSDASSLVANDTNATRDIFVRDRQSGITQRVSVSSSGAQANARSDYPSISADGRFVAFESAASNLVAVDTNTSNDVFVRDRQNGTTERVSVSSTGVQSAPSAYSSFASISADGRFVAFTSYAPNLVVGDTNGAADVFVRDRVSGTTERVSVDSNGVEGDSGSSNASISVDGRFVAFWGDASNLVVGDTNATYDVFVRDRQLGTTERVSVDSAGAQGTDGSYSPSISADGRWVAFYSFANNLVASDTNPNADIFVRDRVNGTTEIASVATNGTAADSYSHYPSISADGRIVAFHSNASNLVANDTNGLVDVFLRDRQLGTTERVSVDSNGAQAITQYSYSASVSADGRFVAFWSAAWDLVPGDTNGSWDVFVRDRGPQIPSTYCTAGTTSNGCNASIAADAPPSVSFANACHITVTGVEGQKTGIVFYGLQRLSQPWCSQGGGNSFLCVKAPTNRTGVQNSGGSFGACDGSLSLDWNAFQLANPSALGAPWSAGTTADVQAWFRDPPSCKTTSLSNA